ncbi:multisubunit sodium/proton antiporter, MrpD subunit [Halovenus aranensis]|uniref:Multisubunit sodium/proton antiporter, MrpD subunit n=1 Tax=Halovenus aranensis TaxID=890420 RepID=A0A1G8TTG3_9EURY|nr:Na(+)/H(+) antiporter subunit D [Halovenus aranensis]SDJ44763.1 multisubunit sodium/proton antiporter, MrpD subunit [Halovenus aranensis]
MLYELAPPFALVLVAAVLAAVLPRTPGHAVGVLATGAVAALSWIVPEGTYIDVDLFGVFDAVVYNVDPFSRLMGLIFGFIGAAAVLYSYASDADGSQTAIALSYVGTSLGAVYAGDWLTLIFFWELMAVTSTLLVWYYGGRAVRSGFRYAVLHGIGGSLFLAAIVWHYAEVGTVAFTGGGITAGVPAALAAIGIGVNVGFVGLHAWLPDTYPSPHFAASVFLCVFTTKTGVYGMYRAFPDGHLWIAYMGGAMAVFGAFAALLQSDMRRLLSYHIQSQVGYMVAGVGLGGAAIGHGGKYYHELATAGAFGHVFNHILYKGLLFMTVGVIIYRTGKESLDHIGGLGRHMPLTAITFAVAALSIAGFPGFNGFVSKGMIIGAADKKHLEALWYLLLIGGVGTFLSFIKLGYFAFLEGEYSGTVEDANIGQSIAMVSVAGLCVLFGLVPGLLFDILPVSAEAYEYTTYTTGHVAEGLVLALLGLVGFAILRGPLHHVGRVPDIDAVYNRGFFYGGRVLVVGVTELYALLDRGAVRFVSATYWVGANPTLAVLRVSRLLPQSFQPAWTEEQPQTDGGAPSRLYIRAGIGTSILLLASVLTVVLVVVL